MKAAVLREVKKPLAIEDIEVRCRARAFEAIGLEQTAEQAFRGASLCRR